MKALIKLAMLLGCLNMSSVFAATVDENLAEPGHSMTAVYGVHTGSIAASAAYDDDEEDDGDDEEDQEDDDI